MTSLTEEECSICLEKLSNEIAHLSCHHFFHYKCIGDWINNNNKKNKEILCPICNQTFEIINIYLPENINDNSSALNQLEYKKKMQHQQPKKTCIIL